MRVIKLGLISLIVFALLLSGMSLLFPSQVRISRAINIQGSKKDIQQKIADIQTWPDWNELYNSQVQVTVVSRDTQLIATRWKYKENVLNGIFRAEEASNVTVVQWYFDFKLKWYPWQKLGSIMFDKQFGTPMESSLHNLKKLVENSP